MRWISPMLMMSGDSFWKSGGTALLFAMPMTKPGTESGRRMHREKPDIFYNEKNQLVEEESPADRKQFSYDRQGGIIEEKNAAGIRLFSYNSRHQQTRL